MKRDLSRDVTNHFPSAQIMDGSGKLCFGIELPIVTAGNVDASTGLMRVPRRPGNAERPEIMLTAAFILSPEERLRCTMVPTVAFLATRTLLL